MTLKIDRLVKFFGWAFILCLSGLYLGCGNEVPEEKAPDVSQIPVNIKIQRFEKDLFGIDLQQFDKGFEELVAKYPQFTGPYFRLMHAVIPRTGDILLHRDSVRGFVRDTFIRSNYDTAMIVYNDTEVAKIEQDLSQMFRYYKYYFPDASVPEVVSFTGYSQYGAVVVTDSLMAIGWDCFLSPNDPRYNPETFPAYVQRTMDKKHLVSFFTANFLDDRMGGPPGERLIDWMLYYGKVLYITDHLLPGVPDSIIEAYTGEQVKWCASNEAELWSYLTSENLLYETDQRKIRKLVFPSPGAPPPIPSQAPGRAANHIGWQVIKAYMQRHPETSFSQLMALQDSQKLLDESKYKPRR